MCTGNIVITHRYIRPESFEHRFEWFLNSVDSLEHSEHTNLYGISIRFYISKTTNRVTAFWTICDGVNFSKAVAQEKLDFQVKHHVFSLGEVDESGGLVNALVDSLSKTYSKYSCDQWSSFGDKLKLFKRALLEE